MCDEMGMHVVVYGNPRDGFEVVGPFETDEDALRYAETGVSVAFAGCEWWIMPLHAPAEEDKQ